MATYSGYTLAGPASNRLNRLKPQQATLSPDKMSSLGAPGETPRGIDFVSRDKILIPGIDVDTRDKNLIP
jgi:hypothetical protein